MSTSPTITGTPSSEFLLGTAADDTMFGLDGNDHINGFDGNDIIDGGGGDDILFGAAGNNRLDGGTGDDILTGGYGGNDILVGGDGADQLAIRLRGSLLGRSMQADGGAGDDRFELDDSGLTPTSIGDMTTLTGGAGRDTYSYRPDSGWSANPITITDFATGAGGDQLHLHRLLDVFNSLFYPGGNPFDPARGLLRLVQDGADTLFEYDLDGAAGERDGWVTALRLQDTLVSAFTVDNFVEGVSPDGSVTKGVTETGTDGEDALSGGYFDDTLAGGPGRDHLHGGGGNDVLRGGDEDGSAPETGDYMTGGFGDDTLHGGAGGDTLIDEAGSNLLDGGSGDDLLVLYSGGGANVLIGGDGADEINIALSNRYREGSIDADGGAGDDRFTLRSSGDSQDKFDTVTITGGAGRDTYQYYVGWNTAAPAVSISDFATGSDGDRFDLDTLLEVAAQRGYEGGNPFAAANGYLRLIQDGADTLLQFDADGAAGNWRAFQTLLRLQNTLVSAFTADNFKDGIAPDGSSTVGLALEGTSADEHLRGGYFDDVIRGGAGDDEITGGGGDDWIEGGDEEHTQEYVNDRIEAGAGNDTVHGGAGKDAIEGGAGDDQLFGGAGADYLDGGPGNDVLHGGDGDDRLYGGTYGASGSKTLFGDAGNDKFDLRSGNGAPARSLVVHGGDGNDTFLLEVGYPDREPGQEAIVASGGAGTDTFVIDRYSHYNGVAITDFQAGPNGDRIDVSALAPGLYNYEQGDLSAIPTAKIYLRLVQYGGDTLVQFDYDTLAGKYPTFQTLLRLENTNAAALTADNFIGYPAGMPVRGAFVGGAGADTMYGTAEADQLIGGAGDDTLHGNDGDDLIDGGDGADQLNGGKGADTLTGGAGDDRYVIDPADIVVEAGNGGRDRVVAWFNYQLGDHLEHLELTGDATEGAGNALANEISGSAWHLKLSGLGGNDRLTGAYGNDYLDGGSGADAMIGGFGNDTYVVDDAGDVVTEGAGAGQDRVYTSLADYTLGANVESLEFIAGGGKFAGTGNALDNTLRARADSISTVLKGEAGDDTLAGTHGNDQLFGGAGNDRLDLGAGGGTDLADGGDGVDTLRVSYAFDQFTRTRPAGGDTVLTLAGADTAWTITLRNVERVEFSDGVKLLAELHDNVSSSGDDVLRGTGGDDLLDGGPGKDAMSGGLGDDTYVVSEAGDGIVELAGEGTDLVKVAFARAGAFTLAAHVEHATVTTAGLAINLNGNDLHNQLTGNSGANVLSGGAGDDTLDGKGGNDTLAGGLGDDRYVVDSSKDVVLEAAAGGADTVVTGLSSWTLSAHVEALTYQGAGVFAGTGNVENNVITGGAGGNTLKGEAGNDTLVGGAGNDQLSGGLGDDLLQPETGADVVDGGAGADTVTLALNFADYMRSRPNATDIVLTASGGASVTLRSVETIVFADGARTLDELLLNVPSLNGDTLQGTAGDDVLNGGLGKDVMTGGLGDDTYVVSEAGDKVVEQAGEGIDTVKVSFSSAGVYLLADHVEHAVVTGALTVNVSGNALDNHLTGNAGKNTLNGAGGDDVLDGGAGVDKLIGGSGDDVYAVDVAGDVVTELAGEGIDRVNATAASWVMSANVEELYYTGSGAFSGTGNLLANLIEGGGGADKLLGMGGDDRLFSGAGADFLDGGLGDDMLDAGSGKNVVDGGAGNDQLQVLGNFADYVRFRPDLVNTLLFNADTGEHITFRNVETIAFADGARTLAQVIDKVATGGNDVIAGTEGHDTLDGGAGIDTMTGGLGDDSYVVNVALDKIVELEGEGTDTVSVAFTAAGTYVLAAHVENASAAEGKLAIGLSGNALANVLTGNAGANVLTGGAGSDTLSGGAGADVFVLSSKIGIDTITDFAGGADKLRISQAGLRIGDGDGRLEGALLRAQAGGFGTAAELVIFTTNVVDLDTASAAAAIGAATSNYAIGAQRLFALDDGSDSALFLFTSSDANGVVSAGELTQLAVLTGVPATAIGDYAFAA